MANLIGVSRAIDRTRYRVCHAGMGALMKAFPGDRVWESHLVRIPWKASEADLARAGWRRDEGGLAVCPDCARGI